MKNHLLIKSPDLVLNTLNRLKFLLIAMVLISSCKKDSTDETKTTPVTNPTPADSAEWSQTNYSYPDAGVCHTLVSKGNTLYAGTDDGMFISSDTGATWLARNVSTPAALCQAIIFVGNTIFAGKDDEVITSTDDGVTWTIVSSGLPSNDAVHVLLHNGSRLFCGFYGSGVYVSSNNGVTWVPANIGLTNMNVNGLVNIGTTVFASTSSGGIFKSTNNGASWIQVSTASIGLWNVTMRAIGSKVFVGSYNGMFVTSDEGATWTDIGAGINHPTPGLGLLTVDGTDLYFLLGSGGSNKVYVTRDNGVTWTYITPKPPGIAGLSVFTTVGNQGYLFAGTNTDGVWKFGKL